LIFIPTWKTWSYGPDQRQWLCLGNLNRSDGVLEYWSIGVMVPKDGIETEIRKNSLFKPNTPALHYPGFSKSTILHPYGVK